MTSHLPEIYRVAAVVTGGSIPATLVTEEGLPTIEKYGIVGLLVLMCGLFIKLWRDSDNARKQQSLEQIKKLEERIRKQDAELELERTRNRPQ